MDNGKIGKLTKYDIDSLIQEIDITELIEQENKSLMEFNKILDEYNQELSRIENKMMSNVVILPEKFNKKRDRDIGKYGISLGQMKEFNKLFGSDLRI